MSTPREKFLEVVADARRSRENDTALAAAMGAVDARISHTDDWYERVVSIYTARVGGDTVVDFDPDLTDREIYQQLIRRRHEMDGHQGSTLRAAEAFADHLYNPLADIWFTTVVARFERFAGGAK